MFISFLFFGDCFLFFLRFYKFYYLFMFISFFTWCLGTVPGLLCCVWAFFSCREVGYSLVWCPSH